jgi:hypothetical protein
MKQTACDPQHHALTIRPLRLDHLLRAPLQLAVLGPAHAQLVIGRPQSLVQ